MITYPAPDTIPVGSFSTVVERGQSTASGVTVVVSLYNYEELIQATLDTVRAQSFEPLSLVVVDDHSTDDSLEVAREWFRANGNSFSQAVLLKHDVNRGLATSRNTGFSVTSTDLVFVVDADNHLYPRAVECCVEALAHADAAFAYFIMEKFGEETGLMGTDVWSKTRLSMGNYIDATALVRKDCWRRVGGYHPMRPQGWEDFDLWCKFAERNWYGLRIPEILARYRVSSSSMLRSETNVTHNIGNVRSAFRRRHPWVKLDNRSDIPRGSPIAMPRPVGRWLET